jgi:5-methylcytosine-specific restriction protein A
MALGDLTREAILSATAEFDRLGRDAFLNRYGFRPARGYFLLQNGSKYDSKAVAGAAHGYLNPNLGPLRPSDFSRGDRTVARVLQRLGFVVTSPRESLAKSAQFNIGQIYHRQNDIHQVYGGQERGGITTPAGVPFVFLFAGDSGEQYGYSDGWNESGIFAYTGEGQVGDMHFVRGNRAVRDHLKDGRDLLLFAALPAKGIYRFLGCFACAGWLEGTGRDRNGATRRTLIFQLVPASQTREPEEAALTDAEEFFTRGVEELRQLAYAAAAAPPSQPKDARRNYYQRSAIVKAYVLARAAGTCELCATTAPFQRIDGSPYLEPHHTRRVADGGPDHPRFVGALCPNCHREIHHGTRGGDLNGRLQETLARLEPEVGVVSRRDKTQGRL